MQIYTPVTAEEVAEVMRSDPDFGMDVLAHFAQEPSPLDPLKFADLGVASMYHKEAAPILHALADAIIEVLKR